MILCCSEGETILIIAATGLRLGVKVPPRGVGDGVAVMNGFSGAGDADGVDDVDGCAGGEASPAVGMTGDRVGESGDCVGCVH